jgi:hypothetical protein
MCTRAVPQLSCTSDTGGYARCLRRSPKYLSTGRWLGRIWAICPGLSQGGGWRRNQVELRGLEPLTPCLQSRCATSCATAPSTYPSYGGPARGRAAQRRSRGAVASCQSSASALRVRQLRNAASAAAIAPTITTRRFTWAWMDLNHRPLPYQGSALTELSYRPAGITARRDYLSPSRRG